MLMSVGIVNRHPGKQLSLRRIKKTAERILSFLHQERTELSLALVGNREIQKLNARYRKKNGPTDVLSFPLGPGFPGAGQVLGDVVISVEQAKAQARQRGKKLQQEVEELLIHGILHLLGYDHERSKKEAKVMSDMEKRIRRALCEEKL